MKNIKPILLAEDDANDVELTLAAFTEFNLADNVVVARDGVEALDYLLCRGAYSDRKKINPAVILLDNKMPRLTGLQVLKTVREEPTLKTIPVVMLTSSSLEKDLIDSYSLGANAYVVKPVDFTEFIDTVKSIGAFWALINRTPGDF